MYGSIRRVAAVAAMLPVVAMLLLAAVPVVNGGIAIGADITIVKVTDPASDPQDFDFDLTGAGAPADVDLDTDAGDATLDSQSSFSVSAAQLGTYTIAENAVIGWTLTDLNCSGDSAVQYDNAVATLDVSSGETIICTFTNAKSPTLTITKVTVPAEDPQDFYIDLASLFNTSLDTDPTSVGTPNTDSVILPVSAIGSHTLHETAVAGWSLTDVDCTGDAGVQYDNAGATLDIDAGENIDCTFTNTKDGQATIEPTDESGGATNAATQADTDTRASGPSGASSNAIALLIAALGVLTAVVFVTRPRRVRE